MEDRMEMSPDDELIAAIEIAGGDDSAGLARVEALLARHPADPRLHFLRGSLLAAQARYPDAREAMGQSIALAPDYEIARFQLGLLELSCGDAASSSLTLEPLAEQGSDEALSLFARGLRHLAKDDLSVAAECLRRGIACNETHPLVSRDMEMIIERISDGPMGGPAKSDDVSAAHLLLQRYADKTTKH